MKNQEQHIEQLRQERSLYICGVREMRPERVAALKAGIQALEAVSDLKAENQRLREVAVKVWNTVPSTYDENDPRVQAHASALNLLGIYLNVTTVIPEA